MGYDKAKYDIDYIQEGNKDDFTFDVDDNFPVEEVGDITFQVRNSLGNELISKTKSTGGITLTNRTVSVLFSPSDTVGKGGDHLYELDFKNLSGDPFATIGGKFKINKEVNKI